MKRCRTLKGLLQAIQKNEPCYLPYTSKAVSGSGGYIIYQTDGTNLIVSDETYQKIESYIKQV